VSSFEYHFREWRTPLGIGKIQDGFLDAFQRALWSIKCSFS
jgi:hypothetical protein